MRENITQNLKLFVENERKYHTKIWEEKRNKMLEVIQFFEKEELPAERIKYFELRPFKKVKNEIFKGIENAEKEIFLDLRCNCRRIRRVKDILKNILQKILEIYMMQKKVNIKLLLKIDDWVVHELDFYFIQLIQKMAQKPKSKIKYKKFEFKTPPEKIYPRLRIFVDNQLFQFLIGYEFTGDEKVLLINDEESMIQAKLEFNHIWANSLDVRDTIGDYKISKKLENVAKKSYKNNPPSYNFTDFIKITGFRKVIRLILTLLMNAKTEILTIIGPVYQIEKGPVSVLEILAQENFYKELNAVIKKKADEKLNIKWIRNLTEPHLKIYEDYDSKKEFIDLVLSLYPDFKMKQLDLTQYQFIIIDRKYLCIFEYTQQFKLIINTDELIIDNYFSLFQKIWSIAEDIRRQWVKEVSKPLKEYIEESYKKIPELSSNL